MSTDAKGNYITKDGGIITNLEDPLHLLNRNNHCHTCRIYCAFTVRHICRHDGCNRCDPRMRGDLK
jgi:queuine/archaeosine tRNA-ribosyltransferase